MSKVEKNRIKTSKVFSCERCLGKGGVGFCFCSVFCYKPSMLLLFLKIRHMFYFDF